MKVNLAWWDRVTRWLGSFFLLSWAFAGGANWAYVLGLLLLITSAWGWCPIYGLLGLRTYSPTNDSRGSKHVKPTLD